MNQKQKASEKPAKSQQSDSESEHQMSTKEEKQISYQFLLSKPNAMPELNRYKVYVSNGFDGIIVRVHDGEKWTLRYVIPFEAFIEMPVISSSMEAWERNMERYERFIPSEK